MSNLIIILAINDVRKIDKILLDRLELISFKNYSTKDRVQIGYKFMMPKIMKNLNINPNDVVVTPKNMKYIIRKSKTHEKGVRQLERNIATIFSRFNTLKLINIGNKNKKENIKLSYNIHNFKLPFELNEKNIDILFHEFDGSISKPPSMMYI